MNELERRDPVIMTPPAPQVSVRVYNLVLAGLILLGFVVMGAGVNLVATPAFQLWMYDNILLYLVGTLAGTIAGILLMSSAVKRQSVARSLVGYALFTCTFGLMTSIAVMNYDLPTINAAFTATAGITAVFGILGVAFPRVFQRMSGGLVVALFALMLVQIVMAFAGVDQTWLDLAVIVVFCGFIGYDMHQAAVAEPTLPNAVFMACNLFLDIMNVFIRLLDIFNNR